MSFNVCVLYLILKILYPDFIVSGNVVQCVCYISYYIEDIIPYVDQRVYVVYKKNDLSLQSKFKLITGRERENEPN